MVIGEYEWNELLTAIVDKKCTPFIGAGSSVHWLPLGREIASKWAEEHSYPLEDSNQLSKVSQYLAIDKDDDLAPKKILSTELKKRKLPDFSLEEYRNTPFAVLADLNLPIYITTNYDEFMEAALRSRGKLPVSEFCRWNNYAKMAGVRSIFEDKKYQPQVSQPLVYHLHGDINTPQSMVLTETDYVDFIVSLIRDENGIVPSIIRKALATTTLLFIGYKIEDINFRVIFRHLLDSLGIRFQSLSIAVLLPSGFSEEKKEKALQYLNNYTKKMFKIDVYWGDALEFSSELRKRLDRFRNVKY